MGSHAAEGAVAELRADIASEEAKFANWRDENVRRKHNYIPTVELLKVRASRPFFCSFVCFCTSFVRVVFHLFSLSHALYVVHS